MNCPLSVLLATSLGKNATKKAISPPLCLSRARKNTRTEGPFEQTVRDQPRREVQQLLGQCHNVLPSAFLFTHHLKWTGPLPGTVLPSNEAIPPTSLLSLPLRRRTRTGQNIVLASRHRVNNQTATESRCQHPLLSSERRYADPVRLLTLSFSE